MKSIRSILVNIIKKFDGNKEVTDSLLRSIPLWIGSFIVGGVAVLYAKLFALAESYGLQIFNHASWFLFIITPLCFVFAWLSVQCISPFARGSGIPQVIAALETSGTNRHKHISMLVGGKIIVAKVLSSIVMVFGGGAVGREGPTIQISAAIFRSVDRFLPAHWPKHSERVLILTGSAAGLAAAFNTPLGGIVFAIEELSKSHFTVFRTTLLAAVIIAGMTAQMLLGPYLYLGYPEVSGVVFSMTGLIILISIIGGVTGAFFSNIILHVIEWKKRFKTFTEQLLFVAGLALLLAVSAFFFSTDVLGSGKETMMTLLFTTSRHHDLSLAIARFVGPLVSFTSGAAGGVFAPALSSGAALGSAFSSFFILSPQQTNVIILSGMVAFLTAVTRSPFTSSILVLEMTDRHSLIFFLMFSGLISYAAAWMVDKHSLYEKLTQGYLSEFPAASATASTH